MKRSNEGLGEKVRRRTREIDLVGVGILRKAGGGLSLRQSQVILITAWDSTYKKMTYNRGPVSSSHASISPKDLATFMRGLLLLYKETMQENESWCD